MTDHTTTDFASYGAQLFKSALSPCLETLEAALKTLPIDEAGLRLHGIEALAPLLTREGCIGAIATSVLGANARPVRAILFNKSPETNWSLAWHQDRTICVRKKREAPGFGPWTVKNGMVHVAPPFDLLTRMITLRAHIEDVPATNAPLLIAPGSHKYGRVAVEDVEKVVELCGIASCPAEAGDVWLYATPILHASETASMAKSRRVLQVDFAAEELPFGLEWLGVYRQPSTQKWKSGRYGEIGWRIRWRDSVAAFPKSPFRGRRPFRLGKVGSTKLAKVGRFCC